MSNPQFSQYVSPNIVIVPTVSFCGSSDKKPISPFINNTSEGIPEIQSSIPMFNNYCVTSENQINIIDSSTSMVVHENQFSSGLYMEPCMETQETQHLNPLIDNTYPASQELYTQPQVIQNFNTQIASEWQAPSMDIQEVQSFIPPTPNSYIGGYEACIRSQEIQSLNPPVATSHQNQFTEDVDVNFTNAECDRMVKKTLSWASNYLKSIGQSHPKATKRQLATTSLQQRKMANYDEKRENIKPFKKLNPNSSHRSEKSDNTKQNISSNPIEVPSATTISAKSDIKFNTIKPIKINLLTDKNPSSTENDKACMSMIDTKTLRNKDLESTICYHNDIDKDSLTEPTKHCTSKSKSRLTSHARKYNDNNYIEKHKVHAGRIDKIPSRSKHIKTFAKHMEPRVENNLKHSYVSKENRTKPDIHDSMITKRCSNSRSHIPSAYKYENKHKITGDAMYLPSKCSEKPIKPLKGKEEPRIENKNKSKHPSINLKSKKEDTMENMVKSKKHDNDKLKQSQKSDANEVKTFNKKTTPIKSIVKVTGNFDLNVPSLRETDNNKEDLRNQLKRKHLNLKDTMRENLRITIKGNSEVEKKACTGKKINVDKQTKSNNSAKRDQETRKYKKIKLIINLEFEKCSDSSESESDEKDNDCQQGNRDLSFLDDFNVDDIVDCLSPEAKNRVSFNVYEPPKSNEELKAEIRESTSDALSDDNNNKKEIKVKTKTKNIRAIQEYSDPISNRKLNLEGSTKTQDIQIATEDFKPNVSEDNFCVKNENHIHLVGLDQKLNALTDKSVFYNPNEQWKALSNKADDTTVKNHKIPSHISIQEKNYKFNQVQVNVESKDNKDKSDETFSKSQDIQSDAALENKNTSKETNIEQLELITVNEPVTIIVSELEDKESSTTENNNDSNEATIASSEVHGKYHNKDFIHSNKDKFFVSDDKHNQPQNSDIKFEPPLSSLETCQNKHPHGENIRDSIHSSAAKNTDSLAYQNTTGILENKDTKVDIKPTIEHNEVKPTNKEPTDSNMTPVNNITPANKEVEPCIIDEMPKENNDKANKSKQDNSNKKEDATKTIIKDKPKENDTNTSKSELEKKATKDNHLNINMASKHKVVGPNLALPANKALLSGLHNRMLEYFGTPYNITRLLRNGKFSKVFQCKDLKGHTYALKVMHPNITNIVNDLHKEEMLKLLQRDIPRKNFHCIFLIDGFSTRGIWCFLMEYYPTNLQIVLAEYGKCFHIDMIQKLSRQLVSAILVLRNNNIAHLGIKPGHILLNNSNDRLKITGFDEAQYLDDIQVLPNMGTVCYRPPEVILGYPDFLKVDVWAAALILYEMATNVKLFPGCYNNNILFKQQCTFGNIPLDMLEQSLFRKAHYAGSIFLRNMNKQAKLMVYQFNKSNRLASTIFKAYFQNWATSRTEQQKVEDKKKLHLFRSLLKDMLVLHPRDRLPIEFAYTHQFVYETVDSSR